MMIRRFVVAIATILAWTSPCPAQPAADQHSLVRRPEVAAALKVFDAWIEATVKQREQPGLSVGIVYDQDLIWAKGYGDVDLERRIPATPATIYRVASISKLFTATAIMQLRDAGRLQLDDPVSQRLSWFSIKKTYEGGPADYPASLRLDLSFDDTSPGAQVEEPAHFSRHVLVSESPPHGARTGAQPSPITTFAPAVEPVVTVCGDGDLQGQPRAGFVTHWVETFRAAA